MLCGVLFDLEPVRQPWHPGEEVERRMLALADAPSDLASLASGFGPLERWFRYDRYAWLDDVVTETVRGTVRSLHVVIELQENGPESWDPRQGAVDLVQVEAAPTAPLPFLPPARAVLPGTRHRLVPAREHHRAIRDRLPATRWRPSGHLAVLDTAGPAGGMDRPATVEPRLVALRPV